MATEVHRSADLEGAQIIDSIPNDTKSRVLVFLHLARCANAATTEHSGPEPKSYCVSGVRLGNEAWPAAMHSLLCLAQLRSRLRSREA